jgi:hypothetical protein
MKIGKLNSRIQRLGSKARGDINKAVGKTSKVIQTVEKGANKALGQVTSVTDGKVVRGIQQGIGIAGRALASSGVPQAQVLGAGLIGAQTGLKNLRKAIPDKVEKAQGRVSGASGKLQSGLLSGAAKASAASRKAEGLAGNALEKKAPEEDSWDELPQYVD